MKNRFKLVGIIVLVAVIGFGVLGCGGDDDGDEYGDGSNVWTFLPAFSGINFVDIAWGNNKFVAIGGLFSEDTSIYTSADGITWTPVDNSIIYDGIVYGGNKFVAWQNNKIATSEDGITWTALEPFGIDAIKKIIWANDKFIGWTNRSFYSTDGVTWENTPSTIGDIYSIAYGNGRYVAFGRLDQAYSTDGINWTNAGNIDHAYVNNIAWGNNKFIATTSSETWYTSSNGESWTEETGKHFASLILWGNNKFVTVGHDTRSSSDGITWTNHGNFLSAGYVTGHIKSVIWANNKFVGVGEYTSHSGGGGLIAYWSGN